MFNRTKDRYVYEKRIGMITYTVAGAFPHYLGSDARRARSEDAETTGSRGAAVVRALLRALVGAAAASAPSRRHISHTACA